MENLKLLQKIAWKFAKKTGMEYGDLLSEAFLAYHDALHSFDENKNTKLSTYMHTCINNKLINICKREYWLHNKYENEFNEETVLNYQDNDFEYIMSDWPPKCKELALIILENPEKFLGKTPNFKRQKKEGKKERLRMELRSRGWLHREITETMNMMKTLI